MYNSSVYFSLSLFVSEKVSLVDWTSSSHCQLTEPTARTITDVSQVGVEQVADGATHSLHLVILFLP